MLTKEILTKRLSAIKLLYNIGVNNSYQNEHIAYFSILNFHDSVEMFLTLAAEHHDIKSEKFTFLEYWKHLPLVSKGPMEALNNRRVALKHKGIIPAKSEVEASRVNATDFFQENTPKIFSFHFSEISLFDLIKFPECKKLLTKADRSLAEENIDDCIENVTIAFYELIREYKENKDYFGRRTHFDFVEKLRFMRPQLERELHREAADVLSKAFDTINKNFERMEQGLAMVALGIDYRKFAKFKILTPVCDRTSGGRYVLQVAGEKIWNRENCEFLINFVLECALRLQEFDFSNIDLIGTENLILTLNHPTPPADAANASASSA